MIDTRNTRAAFLITVKSHYPDFYNHIVYESDYRNQLYGHYIRWGVIDELFVKLGYDRDVLNKWTYDQYIEHIIKDIDLIRFHMI